MPSEKVPIPLSRKRQLSIEAELTIDSSLPPPIKRRKLESRQHHRTPPSWFWDNLSRLWLTPRALREFDRRTVWPAAPAPPDLSRRKNIDPARLNRFARHGGPSLGDLRAYPDPGSAVPPDRSMDSDPSGSRKRPNSGGESGISSKRKTSAYDKGFEQHLIDHGVQMNTIARVDKPSNWVEIKDRIAKRRRSLSPSRFSEDEFETFAETNREALTEATVMSTAFPVIAGCARIPHSENLQFGNLNELTDGSLVLAQPDFYDGTRPAELDKRIRKLLGPYIVPSKKTTAPCLPNFFAEGKGLGGIPDVSRRQALYDGTLGARGIHELRSYIDPDTAFDNNAYTITSTYYPGILTIYTNHPIPPKNPSNPIQYRMTPLKTFALTSDPDDFRQGAAALRNARDWAKEKRDKFIAAANIKAANAQPPGFDSSTHSSVSLSSNPPAPLESETSADEPALDSDISPTPNTTTPVDARVNLTPK